MVIATRADALLLLELVIGSHSLRGQMLAGEAAMRVENMES